MGTEDIEPPDGFIIRREGDEHVLLLRSGREVSRHRTRGGALLAALAIQIEKGRGKAKA